MSRHADLADATAFWRQFVVPFYFNEPGDSVTGFLLDYSTEGRHKDELKPVVKLQTKDGRVYTVTAHQARLRAELVREAPARGDTVRITYHGEAEKAAPGMNKAKDFTVEVKRQGSQSGPGTDGSPAVRGSAAGEPSENEARTGK